MAPPARKQAKLAGQCEVCHDAASKYRCSSCPVRYCSVTCYKTHKASSCSAKPGPSTTAPATVDDTIDFNDGQPPRTAEAQSDGEITKSLKPLTDIAWPPEPDASIFMDPLKRDDPKPLRRDELMRIATSPQLRQLLATPTLPRILRILDSLPTPNARSSCLARLLGVDEISLSKPGQETLLSQRDSPPPLDDLLNALSGNVEDDRRPQEEGGWWLGRDSERIWIGEEEQKLMRVWAGVVMQQIDGEGEAGEWGSGDLAWEVTYPPIFSYERLAYLDLETTVDHLDITLSHIADAPRILVDSHVVPEAISKGPLLKRFGRIPGSWVSREVLPPPDVCALTR